MDQNGISPQTPAMRDLLKSLGIFAEVVELYRQHDRNWFGGKKPKNNFQSV